MAEAVAASSIREELRYWLDSHLPAEWRDISRGTSEERAVSIRRRFGAMLYEGGWAAPSWPVEYGGRGLSHQSDLEVMSELVAAGAPEALNSNGIHIFGGILLRYGTVEQKDRHLRPMLAHDELWCQGFSEPNAGSDLASLRTRAHDRGDHFVLTGQKVWTTFAQYADWCYALVRTSSDRPKHRGISLVMLDMRQDGVTVRPLETLTGAADFNEVFLDEAVVPKENLVGEPGAGWRIAIEALALERAFSFAERSLRLRRELELVAKLIASEAAAGNPRATDPLLRDRLLDSYADMAGMSTLVARLLEVRQSDLGMLPSIAKLHWSESHHRLLSLAFDVLGDRAALPEHQEWVRSLMFTRGEQIYGGTSEIQRNLIAKTMGLPSSKAG
jgi:alkylation response protein AidB-like acyl-CoA dehydrogenase